MKYIELFKGTFLVLYPCLGFYPWKTGHQVGIHPVTATSYTHIHTQGKI